MYMNFTYEQLASLLMNISELLDSDEYIPPKDYKLLSKAFKDYYKILNTALETDSADSVFRIPVSKTVLKFADK